MRSRSRDIWFFLGLSLIAAGFFVSLNIFMLVIGLPLFLAGAVLVFISQKTIAVKILSLAVPVVLWFATGWIFMFLIQRETPETILIPENFQGRIKIVYGQSCGVEPAKENGRWLLQVPANGLLIVKPFLSSVADHDFYYVNAAGKRTKLNVVSDPSADQMQSPAVYFSGICSPIRSNVTGEKSPDYLYELFHVAGPGAPQIFRSGQGDDRATDSLVSQCR